MAEFQWITKKVREFRRGEHHTVPLAKFLELSDAKDDVAWLASARAWGEQQAPKISFGVTAGGESVVIRLN